MKIKFHLCTLTSQFFSDYPKEMFPEIEQKQHRPYVIFLVEIEGNTFGLPLRTNIKHNFAYKFTNSSRETTSSTGIDFSKALILNNPSYIGEKTTIDNKEYIELDTKIYFIVRKFERYLAKYIQYKKSSIVVEHIEYKYRFSTLKYFHKELGL